MSSTPATSATSATSALKDPAIASEIDRRMARAGLRWTRARRIVLDAIAGAPAPRSVPELQEALGRDVPLSSLYRVIGDLVGARILIKLEFAEGFARFELDESSPRTTTTSCAPRAGR